MTEPQQHPLDAFTTPAFQLALAVGAVTLTGFGLWFWLGLGEPLTGAAIVFVALFDVGLLTAARLRKRNAERAREEAGIIEPMDNRPPT